jgi:hypothetical protein
VPNMIFKEDCELEVATSFRDHGGEPIFLPTPFKSGDVCEVDILDRDTKLNNIDVQFGDGTCCFGIDLALVDFIGDECKTYSDLAYAISQMSTEQRNQNITVFDGNEGEFLPVSGLSFAQSEEIGVLDSGHAFLNIN